VWGVSVRGLSRFKNVLQDVQVLQSPTVVVLSHRKPYVFPGYTDHAEIDQAAAVALRPRS
jgi:ABC-type molybdenum transport system ATPase subunit/photorepair protein PhrA